MRKKSEVGERIKRARLEKGLTLKDIEARAGVSATHVSEIERGRTSPTVGALTKIASALGTEPAYLVEESAPHAHVVVRRSERRRMQLEKPAVWLESLAGELPGSELSFLLVDWDRDVGGAPLSLSQQGEEFALVLEGSLEFVIDGERHVLGAGDSIHFAATLPHSARKLGDGRCRALWATYPRLTL